MKNAETLISIMVPYHVTVERVQDLLCNAIEGGSNYWVEYMDRYGEDCRSVEYRQEVPFVKGCWLEVKDIGDGINHDGGVFKIDLEAIKKGLAVMAEKYPKAFADFINENDDAETGDMFLQCVCFGEVIYG